MNQYEILYGSIDPECVELCKTINSIEGLRTHESCCGHGNGPFEIYMKGLRHRNILILLRAMDRRYGCPDSWKTLAIMGDAPYEEPETLLISSGIIKGKKAYDEALMISDNIKHMVNHKAFNKAYSVGKYLDSQGEA